MIHFAYKLLPATSLPLEVQKWFFNNIQQHFD